MIRSKRLNQAWIKIKSINSIGVYEGLALLGIVSVTAFCVVKRSFFFSGTVLGASLVAYILAFFLTSFGLKQLRVGWVRIFYAVAGAAAARWLFEIFYHYAFPISLDSFLKNLSNLSTNTSESNFPLIWSVMIVMVIFTGYKYMAMGRWFWITLGISAVSFLVWILMGYPQWVHPEQWPIRHVLIQIIPFEYTHAPDEAARNAISTASLIMNSIAKIAVCALLPTLFLGHKNKAKSDSH